MSSAILDFFSEQNVLDCISAGIKQKNDLCNFANAVLDDVTKFRKLSSASEVFEAVYKSEACSPFVAMFGRLEQFSRCLLHIFCEPVVEGYDGKPLCDQDAFWITNYKGSQLMEKCISRLMEESEWWKAEVSDMIRKGAGAILNEDKVKDLSDSLSPGSRVMSTSHLSQCHELLRAVRGSTRSQRLATIMENFADPWIKNK